MHSYACAYVSNFKYSDVKLFVLKRGSELQNLVKKFQSAMKYTKIQTEFPQSEKFPQSGKPSDGTFFKKLISEGVFLTRSCEILIKLAHFTLIKKTSVFYA